MIPASLYETIYLTLVTIMTLFVYSQYQSRNGLREFAPSRTDALVGVLVIFLVLFIGFRPVSGRYFVDMANYVLHYEFIYEGATFVFDWNSENKIFDNLFAWWGSVKLGYTSFFVFVATIYFVGAYLGIRKLFPNHRLTAFLVFLAAFSTFSYGTNGIKAGAATSLFIWALGYRENLKICIPLVLLSWGCHHSMIMVVAAFVVTLFVKNPKYYFWGWGFCFLMAAAHVTAFAQLFAGATTEHGAEYLLGSGESDGTRGGFRIDFIVYSVMPVIVGWYAVMKKKLQVSDLYKKLLSLYLCLNGVWMLCMYAEFTNRIAYLSWFLYPIVLIYPFLNEQWGRDRYKKFGLVMLGHLGFTLFMNVIYYG
jgi:hypothetical protein